MIGYTFARSRLGALVPSAQPMESFSVDHSLLPYPARTPYYLRLVNSDARATDYARGGFHVSVTRGLAGGCADLASAIKPTPSASCSKPLSRTDLTQLWSAAAQAYYDAAIMIGQASLDQVRTALTNANMIADRAYGAEGIEPPRDPVLVAQQAPLAIAEPAVSHKGGVSLGWALASVGVIGFGAWLTGWSLRGNKTTRFR